MNNTLIKYWLLLSAVAIAALLNCGPPLIGAYSASAYQNATSVKAETLALMDKAVEPYELHKKEVDDLFVKADKAREFVKGMPSNSISAKQWAILSSRNGDLMGRYFKKWQQEKTLSPVFIGEFKPQVSVAFDEIICLEANKKEATECNVKAGQP